MQAFQVVLVVKKKKQQNTSPVSEGDIRDRGV